MDDEHDARRLLTSILEEYGAKVTTVASASEAIKALEQLQPDVLISDIGMPEDDGYTLVRRVRNLDAKQGGRFPLLP